MKRYDVYIAGGEKLKSIYAPCITKACKSFIGILDKHAKYRLQIKVYASISYVDNYSICSDFVIMQA